MTQETQTENVPEVVSTNENETSEVNSTEITNVEETPKKKPFYKKFRFYLYLFFVLLTIGIILWLVNVFSVYRQASVYKKTYDIVQTEKLYCDGIQGTSQPKEKFDYCDEFQSKFKYLETVN